LFTGNCHAATPSPAEASRFDGIWDAAIVARGAANAIEEITRADWEQPVCSGLEDFFAAQ
jgi:hypothetical protein